jgi:hypothetical protein
MASNILIPGRPTLSHNTTLIASVKTDISESTAKDITVFWRGVNDVSNNTQEGLKDIVNFIQIDIQTLC